MTKEITKAIILQEIQDKLKLREFIPASFLFDETVVPVYNVEQHLVVPAIKYAERSIIAGGMGFDFFTVPNDEKWTLNKYDVVFMASGAYSVTGAYIKRFTGADNIYLDMTLGQTVSYHVNLPCPLVLYPGDAINIYIDGYTSTANLRLYIDVMKEEIR